MKIETVHAENIQSHVDTLIKFHPNLNVIRGVSDSGKSAFMRCMKLVIKNRASKNIRTWDTERSSVTFTGDGMSVSRVKTDTVNGYTLYCDDTRKTSEFKALKSDIPFDIQKALNIKSVNIQEQSDTFFLLDESAGSIAKELNKVSGLSSIDGTLSKITSEINSIQADVRKSNNEVTDLKTKISETEWSIKADEELGDIEILISSCDKDEYEIKSLSSLVSSFSFMKEKIDKFLPETIIGDYFEINVACTEEKSILNEINVLSSHIGNYYDIEAQISEIEIIDLTDIDVLQADIAVLTRELKEISSNIDQYDYIEKSFKVAELNLSKTLHNLSGIELCPTCKRPLEN